MNIRPDVLFVTSTLEVGGSETKIVSIANALARDGMAVAVAYLNPPEALLGRIEPGVEVIHLCRRGKYSLKSLLRLRRLLRRNFKAVFAVNFYPLLYLVPGVRSISPCQSQTICLVNTTEFNNSEKMLGRFYAPMLRRVDQLVFGCELQMQQWTLKYNLSRRKSTYIYNGVKTSEYSATDIEGTRSEIRLQFGIPQEAIVIGSIGRLAPEKNFSLLIQAVGRINAAGQRLFVLLIGDGGERSALEAEVRKQGLEKNVFMPGVLEDVKGALVAMDVFVLPSRAVETFSNAALEAMSMGRPVILSNVGGAAEMVEHGRSGFIFDSADVNELENYILLLSASESERIRIGDAARARVNRFFGFNTMLDRYKKIIG